MLGAADIGFVGYDDILENSSQNIVLLKQTARDAKMKDIIPSFVQNTSKKVEKRKLMQVSKTNNKIIMRTYEENELDTEKEMKMRKQK